MASIRLFSFFSNTNFTEKTVSFSGNRTRIVALEGKHVDHLSTTTAKLYLMHRRDLKFFLRFGHILTLSSWGCHCSLYLYLWPFFRSVSLQLHSLADFYLNNNIHPSIIFYSLFWVCMTLFSHSLFLSIYKLFHSWPSVCLSMYIYLRGPSVTKRKRSRYRKKYFTLQNTFLLKRRNAVTANSAKNPPLVNYSCPVEGKISVAAAAAVVDVSQQNTKLHVHTNTSGCVELQRVRRVSIS